MLKETKKKKKQNRARPRIEQNCQDFEVISPQAFRVMNSQVSSFAHIIGSAEALPIIGSAEALPILCVSDFCERERERERRL